MPWLSLYPGNITGDKICNKIADSPEILVNLYIFGDLEDAKNSDRMCEDS